MKNFIQPGYSMEIVAGAALASGEGVLTNDTFGVATKAAAIGESVIVDLKGVFELPKAAVAISQGAKVYWDNAAKNITNVAMGNTLVGVAHVGALLGDAKIKALLTLPL